MTDPIAAEFGIRQLHARCTDAVWRKDLAAFMDCYTADGEWKVAGLHVRGREEIGKLLEMLISLNERVLMRFGTPLIAIAEDGSVSARTYTVEHVKQKDGAGMSSIGVYFERFVQEGDLWRFRWRHFDFNYFGPPDLSAELFAFEDRGPSPALPGWDAPTAGMQA